VLRYLSGSVISSFNADDIRYPCPTLLVVCFCVGFFHRKINMILLRQHFRFSFTPLLDSGCPSHPFTWTSVHAVPHCDHHEVVTLPLSLCAHPQTQFYPSPFVVFRSRVCPPSPLCTPVLPQPLPLPPEPARLTSPAGAHRMPAGLPPGRHHASVCLTHATPHGYCSPAVIIINKRVLNYHQLSMLSICSHLPWFILFHYTIHVFLYFGSHSSI